MGFAFAKAAKIIEADLDTGVGGVDRGTTVPWPTNRPTVNQPDVQTDSLDPASVGGPAPMNSGQGPYGDPVATDQLLQDPIRPGSPIPHVLGPDEDTTTLH